MKQSSKHDSNPCGSYSVAEIKERANGQWCRILEDAGIERDWLDGRGHPCPRCGGTDRFAAWRDVNERGAVHCRHCFTRGSKPSPGDGVATLQWVMQIDFVPACRWLLDWLGLSENLTFNRNRIQITRSVSIEKKDVTKANDTQLDEITKLALNCHKAMRNPWWEHFSSSLNLPVDSLHQLQVGWSREHAAMTWPMQDASGNIVGIRLRSLITNKKWSVRGGKAGVFVPTRLAAPVVRLYITEGPTDTAAVLSLGLRVFGRASSTGSLEIETALVRRLRPWECVVVADRDEAGTAGAKRLSDALMTCCKTVRVLVPPAKFKDVREWVGAGISKADFVAAVDQTPTQRLQLTSEVSL